MHGSGEEGARYNRQLTAIKNHQIIKIHSWLDGKEKQVTESTETYQVHSNIDPIVPVLYTGQIYK